MADEFKVGVASVDMSPDRPELLWVAGLHPTEPARGVLEGNRLYVDAMAFEAGGRRAVVATSDTGGFGEWRQERIPKAVAERTGIDPELVIMAGRHNHSCGSDPIDKDNPAAVQADKDYGDKITGSMIEACVRAVDNLRPAEIAAATAKVREPIAECRRARFGHGGCLPSWGTGPIAIPGEKFGPSPGLDATEIHFLVAREPGATQPFGMLTSYAGHIHLTSIPYFTAETPGGVKNALRERIPGLTLVYGTATGGDMDMHCVHPVPLGGVEAEIEWFKQSAAELGRRFADAVVPAIPQDGYVRPSELRGAFFSNADKADDPRVRNYMVGALRLGDIAIASIPGEMFHELLLKMRRESPIRHLLLLGFNGSGWLGYIGTPLAYEQGGYETGKGPAPSPEEEARMIAAKEESRVIGKARMNTGLEITETVHELLTQLAE
ncbi:MAG: hypothetical protein JXL80_04320 [Planctomycetes bacterium]|nr:hypothetical protein [Planctomycetota bacterium]